MPLLRDLHWRLWYGECKCMENVKIVVFGNMILLWGGANSSLYIHARFCGDKYK